MSHLALRLTEPLRRRVETAAEQNHVSGASLVRQILAQQLPDPGRPGDLPAAPRPPHTTTGNAMSGWAFRIDPALRHRLDETAAHLGVSPSELVRRLLAENLPEPAPAIGVCS